MRGDAARPRPPVLGTQLREECAQRGLPIDAFEEANPVVLHARVGAELARERFECADEGVLSAIRKHTLGDPSMSRLDAIVYLADGLEPGRDFPERAAFAALALRRPRPGDDGRRSARPSAYLAARGLTPAPADPRPRRSARAPPHRGETHTA